MTDHLGAVPALANALQKRGYTSLTPVQEAMLNPELHGLDALVSAQTGSGKTVAFGIAMAPTLLEGADRFDMPDSPLALVIAPTRELAMQVKRELEWLYSETGATIASCVGGMDIRSERRTLERGAHIVVGTPGRICDHIRRNALDISQLRTVVLDEADEMLDLGFREDLEFILEESPSDRRTLMFSATVPSSIAQLARRYQRDAVRVTVAAPEKQHADIEYRALAVVPSDRENAIINVLRYYDATNAIVFCSTRAAVNHLTARFNNRNFAVVALSGELSQNERTHALQAMRDGRAKICIATDVAARGIDLPGLDLVIHADLPNNPDTLLHRSGRTGRAGRKGISAMIVPLNARRKAERLLGMAGITAEWARPPSADDVNRKDEERLMADPVLQETPREDDSALIAKLVAEHGAEHLASAFINLYRTRNAPPEDLIEVQVHAPSTRPRRGREGEADFAPGNFREPREHKPFGPSVWFSLSVGRKQNAEPRWLIPMICRNGGLSKGDIGAIRIQPEETLIEIAADKADAFLNSGGKNHTLEKGIRLARAEGAPDADRPARRPFKERPQERGNDRGYENSERNSGYAKPRKPYGDRPREEGYASDKPRAKAPRFEKDGSARKAKPAFGKKPFKAGPKNKG